MSASKRRVSRHRLDALAEARSNAIGRLLLRARQDFVARVSRRMERGGVPRFPASFLTLLPYLDTTGTRSTELARRAGISKQAVSKTLRELEGAGLLERVPDDLDGRASLVQLTDRGVGLLIETRRAVERVEREYERLLGAATLATVRTALQAMAASRPAEATADAAAAASGGRRGRSRASGGRARRSAGDA